MSTEATKEIRTCPGCGAEGVTTEHCNSKGTGKNCRWLRCKCGWTFSILTGKGFAPQSGARA